MLLMPFIHSSTPLRRTMEDIVRRLLFKSARPGRQNSAVVIVIVIRHLILGWVQRIISMQRANYIVISLRARRYDMSFRVAVLRCLWIRMIEIRA